MPSTFSPSLRIELIGPGEQAGTWNTTTNTNLGTLIEDAISGVETVSVTSANQALTYLNGTADQSRNAALVLTTTTSDAFSVYAPPYSKLYVIRNASAYAATIYNSNAPGSTTAGGTGVTIPEGKTVAVFSDGTNMAVQINHLITGTTAATATFGTNNTEVATTAFVQAALSAVLPLIYPVGSIYTNATNATNPDTLLGFGTWVAFGEGRVPVGFNAADPLFDTAEKTGGSKDAVVVEHTHTATSVVTDPGHSHTVNGAVSRNAADGGNNRADDSVQTTSTATTGITVATTNANTGVSGTNANLQPYITVFMWKRVS
jgi:hypothetical protein